MSSWKRRQRISSTAHRRRLVDQDQNGRKSATADRRTWVAQSRERHKTDGHRRRLTEEGHLARDEKVIRLTVSKQSSNWMERQQRWLHPCTEIKFLLRSPPGPYEKLLQYAFVVFLATTKMSSATKSSLSDLQIFIKNCRTTRPSGYRRWYRCPCRQNRCRVDIQVLFKLVNRQNRPLFIRHRCPQYRYSLTYSQDTDGLGDEIFVARTAMSSFEIVIDETIYTIT